MYNKYFAIGNITQPVKVKTFPNGKQVANASLGITTPFKGSESLFMNLEFWGKIVDNLSDVGVGDQILIEGQLKMNSWEAKDGSKRSNIICVVGTFRKLRKSQKNMGAPSNESEPSNQNYNQGGNENWGRSQPQQQPQQRPQQQPQQAAPVNQGFAEDEGWI